LLLGRFITAGGGFADSDLGTAFNGFGLVTCYHVNILAIFVLGIIIYGGFGTFLSWYLRALFNICLIVAFACNLIVASFYLTQLLVTLSLI